MTSAGDLHAESADVPTKGQPLAIDVPDPEEAFERLRQRWERGSVALRAEERGEPDWWAELAERLGPDAGDFLDAFEAHVNTQADRWGRDRFRLGYAVAASGLLGAIDD